MERPQLEDYTREINDGQDFADWFEAYYKALEKYADFLEAKAGQHEPIVMLRYDDAIKIAKGCFDYSGGHRDKELEIYHHGIQTVINALKGAKKSNLSDLQSKVLHRKGKAT